MTGSEAATSSPVTRPMRLKVVALIVIVVGIALDLGTKAWMGDLLALDPDSAGPFGRIELIEGVFALEGTYNPGVTFGLAQGQTELILAFTFLATAVLGAWLFLTKRRNWLLHVALGMVLAGALGNLWDRLQWHKVRDFFLFYLGDPAAPSFRWPNFNVADSMIVVGVGLILLDELFLSRWRARREAVRGTTAT